MLLARLPGQSQTSWASPWPSGQGFVIVASAPGVTSSGSLRPRAAAFSFAQYGSTSNPVSLSMALK